MKIPRVIVLIGAGGVGKTSCSTGLAIAIAQTGARVGLLSIDPAKRLADALGIPLGSNHSASIYHSPDLQVVHFMLR